MSPDGDFLRIVSHFPGRLRVRAERLRKDAGAREAAVSRLRGEPGVASASASSLTGSILVLYDPRVVQVCGLVRALVAECGLTDVEPDGREHPLGTAVATRIWEACTRADTGLFRAAAGKLDLRTAVPGALVVGGLAKLVLGRSSAPQWYDLVFWSYVTFNNLNLVVARRRAERGTGPDAG